MKFCASRLICADIVKSISTDEIHSFSFKEHSCEYYVSHVIRESSLTLFSNIARPNYFPEREMSAYTAIASLLQLLIERDKTRNLVALVLVEALKDFCDKIAKEGDILKICKLYRIQ